MGIAARSIAMASSLALGLAAIAGCGALPYATAGEASSLVPADSVLVSGAAGGTDPILGNLPDGTLVLAYGSDQEGDRHVFVATSPDARHWSNPTEVSPAQFTDQAPCLWQAGATEALTFASNRGGSFQLYQSRFVGGTWQAVTAMFQDSRQPVRASIVQRQDGSYLIAYETLDGACMMRTSGDGVSWSAPVPVSAAGGHPTLAALPDGRVAGAFQADGQLYLSFLTGSTWAPPVPVRTLGDAQDPRLLAVGPDLLLVDAERAAGGTWTLYERRWSAGSWSSAVPLPAGGTDAATPALAAIPGRGLALAWGIHAGDGSAAIACSILPSPLAEESSR